MKAFRLLVHTKDSETWHVAHLDSGDLVLHGEPLAAEGRVLVRYQAPGAESATFGVARVDATGQRARVLHGGHLETFGGHQ